MCIQITEEDFRTIHHELGHNFYQRAYKTQPPLFQNSANDGFHEAVGDTIALSVTPEYLKKLGLIDVAPAASGEIDYLLQQALEKIAFLPFGLLVDKWRWEVFDGEVKPENYNKAWWELRKKYQGIAPPVERTEGDFDPGAKYHVPRHMILCPWIEIPFRSLHRRRNPLILLPQFPPRFVVVLRLHFSVEHFPTPLVHQQAKRQERDLLQCLLQQVINFPRGRRRHVDQSELLQVLRRHGKRNRVSHRFVKSVVRTVLKERRLRVVRALIKVVSQLVMTHPEIFFRNLNAHLDSQILFRIHVPRARVTDHVPVRRLGEQRPFPKRLRQRRESQRRKKSFSVPHHPACIRLPFLQ